VRIATATDKAANAYEVVSDPGHRRAKSDFIILLARPARDYETACCRENAAAEFLEIRDMARRHSQAFLVPGKRD
jgi:hypothetical protein